MKPLYSEKQRFTQWWLWFFLICLGALPVYGIYQQLFFREPLGDNPMPDWGLVLFAVFTFLLIGLFGVIQLKTEIDDTEIRIQFFPFTQKTIQRNQIKTANMVTYGFLLGWGIRFSLKYGTVYNTKGNKGLAIELLNGEKFLIGTQKPTELQQFINERRY